MPSSKWEKTVQSSLLEVATPQTGAINFAYMTAYLLAHGQTLSYDSFHQVLENSIEKAKMNNQSEYYAEALLALSFLDSIFEECQSPKTL